MIDCSKPTGTAALDDDDNGDGSTTEQTAAKHNTTDRIDRNVRAILGLLRSRQKPTKTLVKVQPRDIRELQNG
jgi:hypothetical protein